MKLYTVHAEYLVTLREKPQTAPAIWTQCMIELHTAGFIQRIGNSIYLTEKGHEIASRL